MGWGQACLPAGGKLLEEVQVSFLNLKGFPGGGILLADWEGGMLAVSKKSKLFIFVFRNPGSFNMANFFSTCDSQAFFHWFRNLPGAGI